MSAASPPRRSGGPPGPPPGPRHPPAPGTRRRPPEVMIDGGPWDAATAWALTQAPTSRALPPTTTEQIRAAMRRESARERRPR